MVYFPFFSIIIPKGYTHLHPDTTYHAVREFPNSKNFDHKISPRQTTLLRDIDLFTPEFPRIYALRF